MFPPIHNEHRAAAVDSVRPGYRLVAATPPTKGCGKKFVRRPSTGPPRQFPAQNAGYWIAPLLGRASPPPQPQPPEPAGHVLAPPPVSLPPHRRRSLAGARDLHQSSSARAAEPPPTGEWSGVQSVAHSEVSARDSVAERSAALAVQNALDLLFVGAHVPVDSSAGEIGIPDPPAAAFSSRPKAEAAATSVSVRSASPNPEFHQSPGAELPGASSGVALTSEAAEQKDVHLLPGRPQLHGTTVTKSVGRLLEPTKTVFCQQFLPHYHVLVGEVGRWRNTDRFFVVSEDRQRVTELELSREQLVLRPRTGELLLVHITRTRKEDSASPNQHPQQEDSTGSSCHPNPNLSADGRFVLNFVRVYRECLCLDNYFGGRAQTAATSAAPLLGDQPTEAVEDYESHNRTDVPSCVSRALLVNPQKGSVCEVDRVLEARARRTSAVRAAPELQQPIFQVYIQVRRAGDRRWTPPVREPSLVFCELTKQTCLLCPGKGILKIDHGCVVLRRADDDKLLSPERNNYTTRSDSSYAPQRFRNKGPPFSFRPKARPQAEGCSPHTVLEAYENGNPRPPSAASAAVRGRQWDRASGWAASATSSEEEGQLLHQQEELRRAGGQERFTFTPPRRPQSDGADPSSFALFTADRREGRKADLVPTSSSCWKQECFDAAQQYYLHEHALDSVLSGAAENLKRRRPETAGTLIFRRPATYHHFNPGHRGRGHSAGRNYFVPEARPRGGSTSRGGESQPQPGAGAAVDVGSNAYYYNAQEKMGGDIKGGSKSPAVAIKGAKNKGAGKDGGKEAGGKQGSKSPLTPRGKEGEKGGKASGKGEKNGKKSPVPAASKGGTAAGKKGPSPGSGDAIGSLVIDDAGGVVDGSLPLPLPGGGKSVKGSKAKGAVAKGDVAQSNSFLDGEGKKGAKAPPVIVNPPNKGGKGAGKSPPTPRDGSEAPPAQLGVGAKGGKDGGKSPTKGGKAAPETAGKGGKEKGKAPTDKGGLKGLSSAPTTLESAGNKDKGKSAAGKDGKGLPAAIKGKGKKIGKSELVADTGSPIDAFEPAAGDGSKGAGKGKGKKGKARSVSPTTGVGAERAEAGVEEPLQPSGKKSGKLKGKGGEARSASPTIMSAAKGKGTKGANGDEVFDAPVDAAGKSGKGKAAAGKQQGKELKGNKGKTSAASPETTPRGAQKGEKKGLKKPGFATAATAPPLVLSEYDIQLPPPQFLKKGAKKGAEGGKKGPLADVGVPPADYVGASSSAAAGKKGGAAGKKGVKQTSGASATTADHSATEEVEVPAPGDELGAALLGTEGSDTAHLQDAAFGDASTRVTPRAEPPKGSIYEDVTLLDQAYETPALSEAEDTPAERQDQQMLALLRKLEQLGGAVSGTGAAVVAGASADEAEGADSAPRPEGTSGSAPSKTFQALDPRRARGWDDYVCVTLIQVLQIQPQEAVALLLKPSNTLPPGGAPRTYRTLLYDVVLEAEHPSNDMILQPMQSLSMGLRLWLCDLLKQDAELRTRLTEVDYQPFFLFFGQLLSTGCADLVLQLFIRILENADHGRREAAEIFRWLVGANGLHDLVVLLRSSPASSGALGAFAGAGAGAGGGGTNYNRSKPPFVAAVAVADGHAAQASQNPGLVNAYEDSELENENGRAPGSYSYSLGDSKVETDMLVEDVLSGREDEAGAGNPRPAQGTGAGGSSPSTAKRGGTHRQQQGGGRAGSTDAFFGGGRKLHAPLAAYEAALQKEIGAVVRRPLNRSSTDIPATTIADVIFLASRNAQLDLLTKFLPEVADMETVYKLGRHLLLRSDATEAIYWQGALGPILELCLSGDDLFGLCFAAELILTYHDRTLSPMSVDDACARLLDKLRVSALDFPPTEDTYRAWSCLFFLVETFFEEQILRYTSAAYRTICCVFMERGMVFHNKRENESLAQKSDPIRAFALKHLIRFLEHPDVPVGVLAELLLKQLELTQSLSLADLDLLMALAGHGRLALGYASRMLEVLGQACFMNPYYARAATIPFLKLVARFANEDCIYSYVESLTKTGLGYILKEPAKWRNALIVDLLTRVGRMDERVSEAVKRPTVEAAITYLQTFKGVVLQQSLRTILEVWPEELRTLQDAFYNLNYEDEEELVAGAAGEGAAGAGEAHLQSAGAGGESEFKLKPDFLAVGVGLPN